ncbi:unnamed protein product, partial [Nesidiocoris tenuis]
PDRGRPHESNSDFTGYCLARDAYVCGSCGCAYVCGSCGCVWILGGLRTLEGSCYTILPWWGSRSRISSVRRVSAIAQEVD